MNLIIDPAELPRLLAYVKTAREEDHGLTKRYRSVRMDLFPDGFEFSSGMSGKLQVHVSDKDWNRMLKASSSEVMKESFENPPNRRVRRSPASKS